MDICRLCLCTSPQMHNLFEDTELLIKISCMNIELTNDEGLPTQMCFSCIKKVEEIYNFYQKVVLNQKVLYNQIKEEYKTLENIVSDHENIKEECKESPNEIEETKNEYAESDKTRRVEDDIDFQNYSSDDNMTLSFLKLNKKIQAPKVMTPKLKSKDKKKTKQKLKTESEAKENIDTAVVKTVETPSIKTNETFKCLTCFEIFDTNKNLINHYKSKHKPIQIGDKRKNCVIMNGLNDFKCTKCKKDFKNQKSARSHGYHCSQKIEGRPFICNLCGSTFKRIPNIIVHSRVHGVVKYVCSFKCGYCTKYPYALKVHEKRHKKEYKFKCEECGQGFFERNKYEDHRNTHTGARPFTCDLCGESYPTKQYLARHRGSVHHESSKSDRYVCIHCSLPCGNKDALKEHLAETHGLMSYHCDICGMSFSTIDKLSYHKRVRQHMGLKPHTCSTCSKSFSQRHFLKRHMLTHGGVKAHACTQCDKHFQQRNSLVRHTTRYHNTSATNTLNVKKD